MYYINLLQVDTYLTIYLSLALTAHAYSNLGHSDNGSQFFTRVRVPLSAYLGTTNCKLEEMFYFYINYIWILGCMTCMYLCTYYIVMFSDCQFNSVCF